MKRPAIATGLAIGILFAGACAYLKLAHRHDVGWYGDDAVYVLSARSLLHGHYQNETAATKQAEIHFLPGFPCLISPFTLLVSQHQLNRLKIIPLALAILIGFLCWILFRRWLPKRLYLAALALVVLNPLTLFLSDLLISEWLLLALTLLAFLLIEEWRGNELKIHQKIILGIILAWASLTRPEGVLASLALLAICFTGPSMATPPISSAVAGIGALGIWLLRNFLLEGRISTYTHIWHPPDVSHLAATVSMLPRLIIGTVPQHALDTLLVLLTLGVIGIGAIRYLTAAPSAAKRMVTVYFFLFFCVRLIWPVLDGRFFLPLLPIVILWFTDGLSLLDRAAPPCVSQFLIIAVLAHALFQDMSIFKETHSETFGRLPYRTLAFIRSDIPKDATIFSNNDGLLTLYAQHHGNGDIDALSAEEFINTLLTADTRYVWVMREPIADPYVLRQWRKMDAWMQGWPRLFPVIFNDRAENSTIYTVAISSSFISAYTYYLEGRRALAKQDQAACVVLWRLALQAYPHFPAVLNDQAVLLINSGNFQRAGQLLDAALHERPGFALARLNRARVFEHQHLFTQATQQLRLAASEALTADPRSSDLQQWIAEEQRRLPP